MACSMLLAGFECEQGRVADEQAASACVEHGDRIGRRGDEFGIGSR